MRIALSQHDLHNTLAGRPLFNSGSSAVAPGLREIGIKGKDFADLSDGLPRVVSGDPCGEEKMRRRLSPPALL